MTYGIFTSTDLEDVLTEKLMTCTLEIIRATADEEASNEDGLTAIQALVDGYGPSYGDIIISLATALLTYMEPECKVAGYPSINEYIDEMLTAVPATVKEINDELAAEIAKDV